MRWWQRSEWGECVWRVQCVWRSVKVTPFYFIKWWNAIKSCGSRKSFSKDATSTSKKKNVPGDRRFYCVQPLDEIKQSQFSTLFVFFQLFCMWRRLFLRLACTRVPPVQRRMKILVCAWAYVTRPNVLVWEAISKVCQLVAYWAWGSRKDDLWRKK